MCSSCISAEGVRRKLETRRRLAIEVEQGVKAAHDEDPELKEKDEDLCLLKVSRFTFEIDRLLID